jgi:mono/diheme cytochrome c family protein
VRLHLALMAGLLNLALLAGCERPPEPEFLSSVRVQALTPELQVALKKELVGETGTFAHPQSIDDRSSIDLAKGQAVYQDRCVQCHGISGDGDGPAAAYLYPRPRDYRKGLFKFTSTPYGFRPLRSDLERTIREGVRGTSMPAFALLPKDELQAVLDYVLMLTHRGEFEEGLVNLADAEEAIEPDLVDEEVLPRVIQRWEQAESQQVQPFTPQPKFTEEHVALGKKAFLTIGCAKCHGEDGRGQMAENIGQDAWGRTTRAADLTSGMLHGGPQPIDIYRRIYSGINGTPMPSFASALQTQPDTIWHLVAYVKHVSSRRREGEVPHPGTIKPYVPAEESQESGVGSK